MAEPDAERLARLMGQGLSLFCQLVPEGEVLWTPGGVAALSASEDPGYNTAVLWGGAGVDDLARFSRFLSSRGRFATYLLSEEASDALAAVAPLHGLLPAGAMPVMALWAEGGVAPSPSPYRVERLTRWADVRDEAAPIVMEAFGLPAQAAMAILSDAAVAGLGLDVFVARSGGQAVSTVYTTRVGGAVGIWSMATPQRHRRRGAGRAVLEGAIGHHRAQGARLFYLGATAQGLPLYDRLGFRTGATLSVWSSGPVDLGVRPPDR